MKRILLPLFAALPALAFSQANYHSGYVVKNSGDTIRGYINYREWEEAPRQIEFKNTPSDNNILRFKPSEVKAFGVSGMENYISYKGLISMDKIRLEEAAHEIDTIKKLDTVFLRVVSSGQNVTLYNNTDKIRTRFFISENNSNIKELEYHVYYTEKVQLREIKYYLIQLLILVHKYHGTDEKLDNRLAMLHFNEDDIAKAVKIINNNKGKEMSSRSGHRFFISGGLNYTKLKISGDPDFSHSNSTSTTPFVSVGADFFNNSNVQRLVFRGEVSYSSVSAKVSQHTGAEVFHADDKVYNLKQNNITITPQIIYNIYNSDAFKFYLDAGINFHLSTYPSNKITFTDSNEEINKYYTLHGLWVGFPVQTGVLIRKRLELFFRYQTPTSYCDNVTVFIANESFTGGLRFHFTSK